MWNAFMIAGLSRVKNSRPGMSQIGELSALPDVSRCAVGARVRTLRPEGGMDDADRIHRRASRADHNKWEPGWTTLTPRPRFRIYRLRPRGTAQLITSSVVSLHVFCSGAGRTSTRLKCHD